MKKILLKALVFLGVLFGTSVFGSSSTLQGLREVIPLSQSPNSGQVFERFAKILQIMSRLREMDLDKSKVADEELLELALGLTSCTLWEPVKAEDPVVEKPKMSGYDFLRAYLPCCSCRKRK